jgi:hypothetical protein
MQLCKTDMEQMLSKGDGVKMCFNEVPYIIKAL